MKDETTNTQTKDDQPDTATELVDSDIQQTPEVSYIPVDTRVKLSQPTKPRVKMDSVAIPKVSDIVVTVSIWDRIWLYWDTIKKLIPLLPMIKGVVDTLTKLKESAMNPDKTTTWIGIAKLVLYVVLAACLFFGIGIPTDLFAQVTTATDWAAFILVIKGILSAVADYFSNKAKPTN